MFSIISKERRVTNYVKVQAYKWLYAKIVKGEYTAHTSEAENLILEIRRAGTVTETTYKQFCSHFFNAPFYYILNNDKNGKFTGITTNILPNYFVKYNNENLPVGFVEEFFEDDYETKAEIEEYYQTYLDGVLDDFIIGCRATRNVRVDEIDNLKNEQPGTFNTKVSFHVTNVIKNVLAVIGFVINLIYLIDNDVVGEIIRFFESGSHFVEENLGIIIANLFFLLYLLPKIVKLITTIIFYIRLFIVRGYVGRVEKSMEVFNTDTLENFKEHFGNINKILKRTRVIEGECLDAPAGKKQYLAITNFDIQSLNAKLEKLHKKFDATLYYDYNKNGSDLKKRQSRWKKGIVMSVILITIFVFLNIPDLNEWIVDLIASTGIF